jgi:hypothetical protein
MIYRGPVSWCSPTSEGDERYQERVHAGQVAPVLRVDEIRYLTFRPRHKDKLKAEYNHQLKKHFWLIVLIITVPYSNHQ